MWTARLVQQGANGSSPTPVSGLGTPATLWDAPLRQGAAVHATNVHSIAQESQQHLRPDETAPRRAAPPKEGASHGHTADALTAR